MSWNGGGCAGQYMDNCIKVLMEEETCGGRNQLKQGL